MLRGTTFHLPKGTVFMKKKTNQADPAAWLRENKWTCAVLAAALVLLMAGRLLAAPARVEADEPENRAD